MEDSNATDDWLDQHPYIDFSKTDSDDGVVSVRVPIDTLPAHTGRKNSRSNVHVQQDTGTEALPEYAPIGSPKSSFLTDWHVNNATCPGMFRGPSRFRLSNWSKVYVIAAFLESLFLISVTIATAIRQGTNEHPYLYSILAILCVLAFLYYTVDAVYTENSFQLMYSVLLSIVLTMLVVFSAFNPADDDSLGPAWKLTKFGVLGVKVAFQALYLLWALPVHRSFGYYLFKIASASIEMQRLFKTFLSFFSLLKFDLLLCLIYLLMLNLADFAASAGVIIGIVLCVFSVFWTILGWYAVITESGKLLALFAVLATFKVAYLIFSLVTLWKHPDQITVAVTYSQYALVGIASLVIRTVLLYYTWQVYKGFGKGLKEAVFERPVDEKLQEGSIFTAFVSDQ